jgi:hypothetical protein
MAYSVTTLSSSVVSDAFDRDKPVFIGENVLRDTTTEPVWRTADLSAFAGGPLRWELPYSGLYAATDVTNPTKYASDDHTYLQTKATYSSYTPSAGTNDNAAILFDFPEATIDSIAIVNHNFYQLKSAYSTGANPLYVEVWIADDKNFTTNDHRIFRWTDPPSNKPLVSLNLSRKFSPSFTGDYYEQYSGLKYLQIRVLCFGASMTIVPEIGEVVLGRRTQLSSQAIVPYLDRMTASDVEVNDPSTGQVTIYKKSSGMQKFENNFRLTTDKEDFLSFISTYIEYGTYPFIYCPRPSSNWTHGGTSTGNLTSTFPESYFMNLSDSNVSLQRSNDSPFDYLTTVTMQELPPYASGMT